MVVRKLSLKIDPVKTEKSDYVTMVEKTIKTPIVTIKYCYLVKPFFYPGSHVPRYSVSLLFDKNVKEQAQFLQKLESLAVKHGVENLGYETDTGLILIKFQTKDPVKTYMVEPGNKKESEVELQHDLPEGFKASVNFELNTYANKKTQKNGFNFCPKKVIFHLDEHEQDSIEVENGGNSEDSRDRPRIKDNGIRGNKLQPRKKRNLGI